MIELQSHSTVSDGELAPAGVERARALVANLNAAGVPVTFEAVIAEAGDASSIGRPHVARAAGATDMADFFARYLVPGAPTFVPRRWPTAAEACDLLLAAGGA